MGKLINSCAGAELHVSPAKRVKALLFNVPDAACSNSAINSTKRMVRVLKPSIEIVDSGGYQMLKYEKDGIKISIDENRPLIRDDFEINLTPVHVVEAAAILKPDFFVGLDFPIRKFTDPSEQKMEFRYKLGFNFLFARECYEHRIKICPEIPYFQPIQCYNLEQFDQFMDLIADVRYDGFSMPVRNLSVRGIILFMIRFYQMGVRQVHILGTSKIMTIAIAAFMARHLFDWVSFDATTWRKWAELSWYMNPYNLSDERIAQNVVIDERIRMDCECPFCKGITFTDIKNMPDTERTGFLRSHNWWVIEKATYDLYQNSNNVIELKRCLQARGAKPEDIDELCKALSLADSLKNGDIRVLQDLLK
jgi:queuine/archaeosine tRNA-ribosyltransferase